ncbi:SGNH/GDSL hydrolase family protein [Rhizobacter sp. J219]|jgi:lysophospholipase L1-like esterase|uniref:SGNH/GDSL hydrolase family protein n=1 Tax=Rhizobacter sp. J219 TaxID=2898430 RepID=UPI00215171AE|nr:SGNH/GDSL hydrolase family protein [Rhizobacter sp. J219]MCR5885558.1 SGNH/GDSL hydrolase family protein [Rhizobacter sp. J219]
MNSGLFKAIKFLLVPVLLWQGRQVRRDALRLPEAEGPREGVAGTGKVRLRILIVGDSSAAGVGAKNQIQALAGRLSEALSQRLHGAVVWQLIARSGDSTRTSLAAVRKLSLHPADVMVTALGLNDVVSQVPVARWLAQLDKLDRAATRRAGIKHVVHTGIPPVHAFPLLPNPLRWVLGTDAQAYNQALSAWTEQWPERWWLPVPIEPDIPPPGNDSSVLMAEDGFHPGPAAYAMWAEQLAGMIVREIVPRLPATLPTRRKRREAQDTQPLDL